MDRYTITLDSITIVDQQRRIKSKGLPKRIAHFDLKFTTDFPLSDWPNESVHAAVNAFFEQVLQASPLDPDEAGSIDLTDRSIENKQICLDFLTNTVSFSFTTFETGMAAMIKDRYVFPVVLMWVSDEDGYSIPKMSLEL